MKETRFFEKFRAEHNFKFSDTLFKGQHFYPAFSFKRTAKKIVVDGETRTIMAPTPGTLSLAHNLYSKATLELGYPSIMAEFFEKYDNDNPIYTSNPFSVIKVVRVAAEEYKHKSLNVSIQDIGAEYLDGIGYTDPLHTLEFYRLVDSDYNVHYVLSTSLAMLEVKSNELHNDSNNIYNDEAMFSDSGINITEESIHAFILGLCADYFDIEGRVEYAASGIILLNPSTTDFEVMGVVPPEMLNQVDKNLRIGMIFLTNEEYTPFDLRK